MAMALAAATVATAAGLLVSRTLTSPLQRLHQQTQRGSEGLHSSFKLNEMNWLQLGHALDQMATKLTQTLAAPSETAVRTCSKCFP